MRPFKIIVLGLVAALLCVATPALAQQPTAPTGRVHVDITEGNLNPMPVAVIDFLGGSAPAQQVGRDISGVIRLTSNVRNFRPIGTDAFIEHIQGLKSRRFCGLKSSTPKRLLSAKCSRCRMAVSASFSACGMCSAKASSPHSNDRTPDGWRRIAHRIADQIYEQLTGERGYFDTRVCSCPRAARARSASRLMIMDQDGANPSFLTGPNAMVLTPRFAPNTRVLTYMS